MSDDALRFEHLTYRYPGVRRPALRDVSLRVAPGEFVVVSGLSAGGKSTLLRAAAGLVPHVHGGTFEGHAIVGGLDTREHGPGDLAAVAGTLLQDPETQIVMTTVRAELAFGLENRGLGAAQVARGVEEVALALGIERLLARPTDELSGGELQRVALGAALAGRPRIVLLDEPTSQLDPVAGDELVWLLRRLNEEWGTAVVLAEHRLERCLHHADRVVVLDGGEIVCDARPPEFLAWAPSVLRTPAAQMFALAGLEPLPASVKEARASLAAREVGDALDDVATDRPSSPPRGRRARRRARAGAALAFDGVWHELARGPVLLRDLSLVVAPRETVALMGRNGAGKSTLLRHAVGLMAPSRGTVTAAGRVALAMQNPGDYLIHERVADEAPRAALEAEDLLDVADRHPRDLSGGQRQRLALAIVLGDPADAGGRAAVVGLDEPTRGMDRGAKAALAERLRALAAAGAAVIVATHDAEFAAAFAQRVVLLADGQVIADGGVDEVLTGGWYFATETARVLGGALTPADGAALLRARLAPAAPTSEAVG
jgi:energy-coupling factor transport system ATP-binding protein